jgi:hypothetical protein
MTLPNLYEENNELKKSMAHQDEAWRAHVKTLNTTINFWRRKYQEKVFLGEMYRKYIPKRDLKEMSQKAYQMAKGYKFED